MENIEFTPDEFLFYLQATNYNFDGLRNIKKFKGKHFIIKGDLNLHGKPIQGKLYDMTVEGKLNISSTQITSIENVETKSLTYYDTPYYDYLQKLKHQRKLELADEMRQENVWDLNDTDSEGEMANAVFQYAVNEGDLDEFSSEDIEKISEINSRIESLENERNNLDPNDPDWNDKDDELMDLISELMDEITELEEDKSDVYDLVSEGSHWDLNAFRSLTTGFLYAVGDQDLVDSSLQSYFKSMVDDHSNYFDNNYLERYIDGNQVADFFEESVREDIEENGEFYGIEKKLSRDQEEEIWLLEMEKNVYTLFGVRPPIYEPTAENGFNIFDFTDIDYNRFEYKYNGISWVLYMNKKMVKPFQFYDDDDSEDIESQREERISQIEYEIEDIKENPDGELDDDSVEEAIENRLDEIRDNPIRTLNDYGYTNFDEFIDLDELLDDLLANSDPGELNSYDGTYDEVEINGTWYTVMRID